jgi:hypothetical protein
MAGTRGKDWKAFLEAVGLAAERRREAGRKSRVILNVWPQKRKREGREKVEV